MQCHSPHAIPPLWQRAQNVVATATRCTKQLCAVPGHPIIHDIGAKLSGGIPPIGGQNNTLPESAMRVPPTRRLPFQSATSSAQNMSVHAST